MDNSKYQVLITRNNIHWGIDRCEQSWLGKYISDYDPVFRFSRWDAVKVTVINTPNETAETISDIIMNPLEKYALTEKCISLTADNANVNFGGINRQARRNVLTNLSLE